MKTPEQQAQTLGQLLHQKQLHFSCAESCTGGGIAYAITSVSGSSAWFNQSWVTYSNQAKHQLLNVSDATLSQYGAVSPQVAAEMVLGVKAHSDAQVCVSVTGIAGPAGGSEAKPVGLVWFGFILNDNMTTVAQQFLGDRESVRQQAIHFALAYCIENLELTN